MHKHPALDASPSALSGAGWLRYASPALFYPLAGRLIRNANTAANGRRPVVSVTDAIMKLGTNFPKVRKVVTDLGLADRALYVERATMKNERILPLAEVDPTSAPYFSIVLVPGRKWLS